MIMIPTKFIIKKLKLFISPGFISFFPKFLHIFIDIFIAEKELAFPHLLSKTLNAFFCFGISFWY
ncbi:hypothetical protein Y88_1743 [Novosphingobium nitrogenifigens DSM 19370]|uniref:Uncharacterized protein n=1 Tax=Novosphingobium nitrogenifigens DSM 19370 TaxID=983920 RepID=F1Z3Q7_9SPHN|nr:hypothetical protein Y88_1743 [Novosphingobium nitrogenifigens DSM 19370]